MLDSFCFQTKLSSLCASRLQLPRLTLSTHAKFKLSLRKCIALCPRPLDIVWCCVPTLIEHPPTSPEIALMDSQRRSSNPGPPKIGLSPPHCTRALSRPAMPRGRGQAILDTISQQMQYLHVFYKVLALHCSNKRG